MHSVSWRDDSLVVCLKKWASFVSERAEQAGLGGRGGVQRLHRRGL